MAEDDLITQALADAAKPLEVASNEKLASIADLIAEQIRLEGLLENLKAQTTQANLDLEAVRDRKLPEALLDMNCTGWTTPTHKVTIKKVYYASVTRDNAEAFYDWLEANNNVGILNTNIIIPYGKGGRPDAKAQLAELEKVGINAELSEDIHWATLRAFAKEQTEAGRALPPTISVHPVDQAVIKLKE